MLKDTLDKAVADLVANQKDTAVVAEDEQKLATDKTAANASNSAAQQSVKQAISELSDALAQMQPVTPVPAV